MGTKSVNIPWKIMMIPAIAVFLMGLIIALPPSHITIGRDYQLFMGQPWADFVSSNARLGCFISLFVRVFGIQVIIIGILAMAVTLTGYKRGEKWAWYVLLIGNTLGWGSGLVWVGTIGTVLGIVVYSIILLVAYVGLAISAKCILKEKVFP
ncbi:MAG: hypothetical protein KKE57_01810 [Proteobacteria bacterium]|nr:hypothetical protein [Pseudomonadota bacterium]